MIEVILEKLIYGGDAMGRLRDGRAVFVPFGLPGEKVRIRLKQEKKNYARAELLQVLEPSPNRVMPKCTHFGECGGCHYQSLPYELQLKAKTELLEDQLVRIGKLKKPPIQPIISCTKPWNYRNHVQFHLTSDGRLGYIGFDTNSIIPIDECHLPEDVINELWPKVRFEAGVPIERVSFRIGINDNILLILESESLTAPNLELEAGISVVHMIENDALVMAGDDHINIQILDRNFHVSAGSFFQVNKVMAEKLVEHILDKLPLPAKSILDIYCGVGLFSAFLAPQCERLIGIESSPSACDDFSVNLDQYDHVELFEATVEDVIPYLEVEKPVVLVDPPRGGVDKHALDGICQLTPEVIAYVSCDPATLARDTARLNVKGYHLVEVTPFDLFPHTYHIESIAIFKNKIEPPSK